MTERTKREDLARILDPEAWWIKDRKGDWSLWKNRREYSLEMVDTLVAELRKSNRLIDKAGKAITQELLVGWDEDTEQVRSIYPKIFHAMIDAVSD